MHEKSWSWSWSWQNSLVKITSCSYLWCITSSVVGHLPIEHSSGLTLSQSSIIIWCLLFMNSFLFAVLFWYTLMQATCQRPPATQIDNHESRLHFSRRQTYTVGPGYFKVKLATAQSVEWCPKANGLVTELEISQLGPGAKHLMQLVYLQMPFQTRVGAGWQSGRVVEHNIEGTGSNPGGAKSFRFIQLSYVWLLFLFVLIKLRHCVG